MAKRLTSNLTSWSQMLGIDRSRLEDLLQSAIQRVAEYSLDKPGTGHVMNEFALSERARRDAILTEGFDASLIDTAGFRQTDPDRLDMAVARQFSRIGYISAQTAEFFDVAPVAGADADVNASLVSSAQPHRAFFEKLKGQLSEFFKTRGLTIEEEELVVSSNGRGYDIGFRMRDADGKKQSLVLKRYFDSDGKVVDHSYFVISPGLQNMGISPAIMKSLVDYYQSVGIEKVTVHANIDVGGYVWARYGFVPQVNSSKLAELMWRADPETFEELLDLPISATSWHDLLDQIPEHLADSSPRSVDRFLASFVRENAKRFKGALLGSSWQGVLDLTNGDIQEHFHRYVTEVGARSDAYKHIHKENEQLAEHEIAANPRPQVEEDQVTKLDKDLEDSQALVAEEERIQAARGTVTKPKLKATTAKDKKTILKQDEELQVHRAARIAARNSFLAGAEAAGVGEAASFAASKALFGLGIRDQAKIDLLSAAFAASAVLIFFPLLRSGGKEPTANEQLREAMIRHQIYVLRYAGSTQSEVLDILNKSERDLRDLLERGVGKLAGKSYDAKTEKRLKELLKEIEQERRSVAHRSEDTWRRRLKELAEHEGKYMPNAMNAVSPTRLDDMQLLPAAQLRALVDSHPFQGQLLSGHVDVWRRGDMQRIESAIRTGLTNGETINDITRRVVGTNALRGTDGATQVTRNQATAITRTAVNSLANAARAEVLEANADIVEKELFVATLDSRTTPVCRADDGKVSKRGKGPQPPLHWQCRSVVVPLMTPEAVGKRPMKKSTEARLLREYAEKNDLGVVKSRDDLPRGTKGDFDEYARARVRQMTGRVPANTTYQQFLKDQPQWFQEDVLGVNKAKLFRDGELPLERFVDSKGHEYTLHELARRDRDAFLRAGLDPEDF